MPETFWNILLIEDDHEDYLLTREILTDARQGRFKLHWVNTYQAGLEAICSGQYDIALLDYELGVMTGLDLLRSVADRDSQVPVILLTGRGSYDVDVEAMQAGAMDYLSKSEVTPALLERSIRYAIERRQSAEILREQKFQLEIRNQQIRESEERFRLTLARTPIVVFTMDRELRYTWVHNPRHNLSNADFLGHTDEQVMGSEAATDLTAMKRSVLETGQGLRREVELNYNGEWARYDMSIEPLPDGEGQIMGVTGAGVDITLLRQLEARQAEITTQVHLQHLLLENREQERQQIARDLHDGPIQDLIALIFAIEAAQQGSDNPKMIRSLREITGGAQKLISELRGVCNHLRPPILAQFGLSKAIHSLAKDLHRKNPELLFQLDLADDTNRLTDATRLALYRIFQESINNIVRHAGATQIIARLSFDQGCAELEITDNGAGFEVNDDDWMEYARHGHLGLVGMKERAEATGGKLYLSSHPGEGTHLRIEVPIAEEIDPRVIFSEKSVKTT